MVVKEIERNFIVRLARIGKGKRHNKAERAIKHLQKFGVKHFKVKLKDVLISTDLNEFIWQNSKSNIPTKVEIVARKSNQIVRIYLKGSKQLEEKVKTEKKETKKEEKVLTEKEIEEKKKLEEKKIIEKSSEKLEMKRK